MKTNIFLEKIEKSILQISECEELEDKSIFSIYAENTVEMMIRFIWLKENNNEVSSENSILKKSQYHLLKESYKRGYLRTDIYIMMDIIRKYRNYAANYKNDKDDYHEVCMPIIKNIIDWFYSDYLEIKNKSYKKYYSYETQEEETSKNDLNVSKSNKSTENALKGLVINEKQENYNVSYHKNSDDYSEIVKKLDELRQDSAREKTMRKINDLIDIVKNMEDKLDDIGIKMEKMDLNILKILDIVNKISDEVKNIKKSAYDTEEKIVIINKTLDKLQIDNEEIDTYISIVKRWLNVDWQELDDNSKNYLPSAEFLFGELSKFPEPGIDLSPFIMQYCRALENEMLKKVFRAYISDLITQRINVDTQFNWDLYSKDEKGFNRRTQIFAKKVRKYTKINNPDDWFFEFGTMLFIMKLLNENRIVSESPILIDLRKFIRKYFEDNIMDFNFLNSLEEIKDNYRNKSAHSNIISIEVAKVGRNEIRDAINIFFECYKDNTSQEKNRKESEISIHIQ